MDIIKEEWETCSTTSSRKEIKAQKTFEYLYKAMCSLINIRGIIDEGLDVEGNEDIIL